MARVVVVGAGISGLSLAWYLRRLRPEWELVILEGGDRCGGKVFTVEEEGFIIERGVNGFLDNKPGTLDLASALEVPLYVSSDAARRRFIVKRGRLVPLPESPGAFLKSPLLSPGGKLRLLMEPFVPKRSSASDESLASFARRRLGNQALQWLIDPMATGIYAGDPQRLSLRSCFPRIHELEQDYGSLFKAMFALKRKARKEGKKGPGAGPGGTLTSFEAGMGQMIAALQSHFRDCIKLGSPVEEVVPSSDGGWEVNTASGESLRATHVVLAAPAHDVAEMAGGSLNGLSSLAAEVEYPPVAVIAIGLKKGRLKAPLNGFGFLAPGCERRQILGALWDSAIFPNRAPEGYELIRVLVGGARNPDIVSLEDVCLLDVVLKELKDLMGLDARPDFTAVYRWERAIPQYNVGHATLEEDVNRFLKRNPGLYVRCNWMGGVSFNDCIANSRRLAEQMGA